MIEVNNIQYLTGLCLEELKRKARRKQVEKESRLKKKVKIIVVMQPQSADRAYYLLIINLTQENESREPFI